MAPATFRKATRGFPEMDHPAVAGLALDIAYSEFMVLVGPSGCGRSTCPTGPWTPFRSSTSHPCPPCATRASPRRYCSRRSLPR